MREQWKVISRDTKKRLKFETLQYFLGHRFLILSDGAHDGFAFDFGKHLEKNCFNIPVNVLCFFQLVLLPKIMSDPETRREMEQMQLPKLGGEMPEMSELLSKFLGGGTPKEPASSGSSSSGTKTKKRN